MSYQRPQRPRTAPSQPAWPSVNQYTVMQAATSAFRGQQPHSPHPNYQNNHYGHAGPSNYHRQYPQRGYGTTEDGYSYSSTATFDSYESQPQQPSRAVYECCSLKFTSHPRYVQHQSTHVPCCLRECSFVGDPRTIEIHQADRHLIYKNGAPPTENAKPDGPLGAKILGLNISLDTDEDIQKWLEERKRRWPSKKVVNLKREEELKRKAYALPGRLKRQSESNESAPPAKIQRTALPPKPVQQTQISDSDSSDYEDDFQAANLIAPSRQKKPIASSDIESDEDPVSNLIAAPIPGILPLTQPVSDDEQASEHEEPIPPVLSDSANEEDSAPEAVTSKAPPPIVAVSEAPASTSTNIPSKAKAQPKKPCRNWIQHGSCRAGKRCYFAHEKPDKSRPKAKIVSPPKTGHGDLLGKLLSHEVTHEISDLLQVITFLARNEFLRNVEMEPGQAEEYKRKMVSEQS